MLKNILKRTLSTFLALMLVVSTVCIFDLSGVFPTASASISSTASETLPDVTIIVPETFYMQATPVWDNDQTKTALNGVDFTSVQYYINNTLSGSTVSPDAVNDATSGKIYFKAASGTVSNLKYSIVGTNKQDVSITAGSSANTLSGVTLNNNMPAASTRTLEWIFTCTINGTPAEYHAFTVAYAPYYAPVGAMINAENSTGSTSQMQGMAWISGVHGYTDGNLTRDDTSSDNSLETNHRPRDCYEGEWYRPMIPIVTPIDAARSNNQSITDWFTQGNIAVDPTFSKYWAKKGYIRDDCYFATMSKSHIANLTVDYSRNKNFKTIPNVTTGILVSDLSSSDTIGAYGAYVANYAGTVPGINFYRREQHSPEYLDVNGSFTTTANNDVAVMNSVPNMDITSTNTRPYTYDNIPYNSVWDRATPTSSGTSMHYIHSAACGEKSGDWIYLNMYLQINVTAVNKATLRSRVIDKLGKANFTTLGNGVDVDKKLKAACAALGDPTASQSAVDSASNALNNLTLSAKKKLTTAQHINARTGALMDSNAFESHQSGVFDAVTVSPNTYTGYTLTSRYMSGGDSLFSLARWSNTNSAQAGGNQTISYDAATDTLKTTVTTSDTHTRDYRSTSSTVASSGYDYFAVDPYKTYALSFDYAGTGNGDIGLHCYDKDGKWLGVIWIHTKNYSGLMAATGTDASFRRDTFYFCPAMHNGISSLTAANAKKTRYVSLCFGGFPNNDSDSSYGPAATAQNPLTCVFRNVSWTQVESLMDMDDWWNSDSGNAGQNQEIVSYDTTTNTLTLKAKAGDTFTAASRNSSIDIRNYNYFYFEVDAYNTYTFSYDYAGTGNGDIGVMCYDKDGRFLGNAWFHSSNYAGMMTATGSDSTFVPGSFDFCPATFTRPSGNTTYITPEKGVRTRYISLSFGGYPNSGASSSNPVSNIFRNVRCFAKAPQVDLFDSAAWAASNCAANGSGVSSVNYDASTDTIEIVNSGTDTYTKYETSNILNSGYYFIPVDPDGTYTLDFDYASPTRAEIGVICYDSKGNRVGNVWLFDSLKASGSTSTFRHHTEVISPQSNNYMINSSGNSRFDIHYISLTFGNYAEGSQTAATCLFRNVSITKNNELFDMAQWAFRSANRYKDGNASLSASDLSYDSETKTLTINSRANDTISAYADSSANPSVNLKDSVTVSGTNYRFFYTPVESSTNYTFEGEYAGTGNGDLGIIEYKADGTVRKKNWRHKNSAGILNKTGSDTEFTYFSTSITTESDTKYIALCFGGYPNSDASASNPVTCIFRDVKMHLTNSLTVPDTDSAFTFYYRPNLYYVAYDGNGSTSGSMNSQRFFYDAAQNLSANAFQRNITLTYDVNGGDMAASTTANLTSTFAGWAQTSGGNVAYSDGQSVSNLTVTDAATVTLYAKWNDGSVTLPEVVRGGYTFDGWYTSGGVRVGTTNESYTPDADGITLVAHWSANTATVTFNNSGVGPAGNMPPDMTLTYNTASQPLQAPKSPYIDGWEFLGWTADTTTGGIGDDEENISLSVNGPRRTSGNRDSVPSNVPTVSYHAGDVIPVSAVNDIVTTVGNGNTYTLYAVWQKTLKAKFVDYNGGVRRELPIEKVVYNGADDAIAVSEFQTQGQHTGWVAAGWTMSMQKGAAGSSLGVDPITLESDNNLFQFDEWANSTSNAPNSSSTQTLSCDLDSETLSSHATSRDAISKYNDNTLGTSNFYRIQVDPYRTYTFGVDYAGTCSGQVGIHFYDASGNFISRAWLFEGTSSANGDPHRGGDHFGATGSVTTFEHEDISICPMTFENYNLNMTEAQRASVRYIAFSFGNYSDDNVSSSSPTDVKFRNITFTQDVTYYGVYTQSVALTYDQNLTATVQNMPQNPSPKNRVANSALGFGDNDIFNPTFALSSNQLQTNGYTYQGWNTNQNASTGAMSGNVTLSESTTYYAIWTANTFYFAFDKNGIGEDSNMPTRITASYNADTANLPAPTNTTVDGWVFQGWALPGALTTSVYVAGSPIPAADTASLYDDAGGEGEEYTLYAVWKKTITATFIDYPNGSLRTTTISKDVFNGAQASVAANEIPTQGAYTGWTSAGWTILTTKGATGSAVGALTLSQNITYYGVYTKEVSLTYDANTPDTVTGMPQNPAAQTCFANSALGFDFSNTMNPTFTVSSAEPERTGYVFDGWTDRPSDTAANTSGTIELNESKVLYAVWSLAEYTLTVEASVGGTVAGSYSAGATPQSISVAAGGSEQYTVKYSYLVFNLVPTQATGYTFSGWTATGYDVTAQSSSTNLSFNMPAGDVTLKANFTPNPYTITYNHGDGATGNAVLQNCTYNEDVTLYTNNDTHFSKTGYTFSGWNNASDGTGANSYSAGQQLTKPNFVSASGANYDLYATWTQNDYTITYNLQGGTHGGASHPTSATFDDPAFAVSAPTRDGYDFAGWKVTSGLDATTAKWGTSAADTTIADADTVCFNGVSGVVYFRNLASADDAAVTLTATWSPRNYTILYASARGDNVVVNGGSNHPFNANVTMPDETVLGVVYAGYSFVGWVSDADGDVYGAGDSFKLEQDGISYRATVTMSAQWSANSYRIVYNLNNNSYTLSDIVAAGTTGSWEWKECEDEVLSKEPSLADTVIVLHGAFADDANGEDDYFYLSRPNEIRFGLGWSYTAGTTSTDNMIPFGSNLMISSIPASVLTNATPVVGEDGLYEINLYMIWSANYYSLERAVAQFQNTYMTFGAGASTLRDTQYENSVLPVYTSAPTSAMLPAIANVDAEYRAGGARAREIEPNTSNPAHGKYAWVAGSMSDVDTSDWNDLEAEDANDFTEASLLVVNGRIRDILEQVIFDPCTQFDNGDILPDTSASATALSTSVTRLNDAMDSTKIAAGTGYLLSSLRLKDADLDYRLTDAEMTAINAVYGTACETASGGGISYSIDSTTAGYLTNVFGETLENTYPECITVEREDGEMGHHSFNDLLEASNVLGRANAIFETFGFDPTQARDDLADYFTSGNVDASGYTINNNCPYTTQSVYRLFDLIYGQKSSNNKYLSTMDGGLNINQEALYYQVKDILGSGASTLLKKPSQDKLNRIVAMISYEYHRLELKDADYTEFINLFQNYFDATWGPTLRAQNYPSSNLLSAYQGFFTTASYNALDRWLQDYFYDGVLWPNGDGTRDANGMRTDFPYYKIVEQNMVNGKVDSNSANARTYHNAYINVNSVDLTGFNYASCTLCAELCDKIDELVPARADYSEVFRLIARNARREADTDTFMIDTRACSSASEINAALNSFYPSTASTVGDNYTTWYTYYADADNFATRAAWEDATYTVTENDSNVDKPLFDTEWLYRYYTEDTVEALRTVLAGINWNLNKMSQPAVDGRTGSAYSVDTVCRNLLTAINNLQAKEYVFYFYYGLPDNNGLYVHIDDFPEDPSDPNTNMLPYHFGMTFESRALTPDASLSSGKTFYGWFTKRNDMTHCVSSAGNIYVVNLPIDETLLETWVADGKAEVSSTDGEVFKVNLYGGYVENVTLQVNLSETGTATYTPADETGSVKTAVSVTGTACPTFNYGWTLTFTDMAKPGYRFREWSFQKGSNNEESVMNGNVYTFGYYIGSTKTDDTLTAVWDANTYTVTFHANASNATGSMSPQTLTYDTQTTLTPNAFRRAGYVFDVWTTNNDGTGTTYADEAPVLNLSTTHGDNIDLYVRWSYADYTLTFHPDFAAPSGNWYNSSLATFEWSAWDGSAAYGDGLTKTITFAQTYNAEDSSGHTWPANPKVTYEISGGVTVTVSFLGWYTAIDGGSQITPSGTVNTTESLDVYPHFNFERTKLVKDHVSVALEQMNANDYTMASMKAVDAVLARILDNEVPDYEPTDTDLQDLQDALDALEYADENAVDGDTTPPVMTVYENKAAMQAAITNNEFTGDASYLQEHDDISYVFPGKCYYTYYCYTNSTTPALIVNAHDIAGANNRVSYPTTFNLTQQKTKSGIVKSGWMNYTYDPAENNTSGRIADFEIMERRIANPYRKNGNDGLQFFGMNYSEGIFRNQTGYNFYTHEQYVLLKPVFVENGGKQFALYTFQLYDDAYNPQVATRAKLAGAGDFADYATEGANLSEPEYDVITPVNTITIYVEYNNTMRGEGGNAGGQYAVNGVGTYGPTGALEVCNNFHEDGNTWVNVDYLYRNSAGNANTDFVIPKFKSDGSYDTYIANDPVYGQTDVGSFYYLMKSSDPATTAYWNAYDRYLVEIDENDLQGARAAGANAALGLMKEQVIEDMKNPEIRAKMNAAGTQAVQATNGDYIYWPYTGSTQWSTQFYSQAHERTDRLVYVHIYDRWGNHYTNILIRDPQDTYESVAAMMSRGRVTVNEIGGSAIRNISITELNSNKPVAVSGMTDDQTWNVVNNQFTVTGLPQGNNNYNYTMTITDNAGSSHVENFQASADGSVVVTVNDETMGGSYAAAAAAPLPTTQDAGAVNGIGIAEIEEAALTTLSINEVQPDAITVNTIEEAQITQSSAEERPDLYTFTLNEIYTVNLFADSTRDYELTLKSTVGGMVKAYVNGEFSPAKGGKVLVPSGSQVQIRIAVKAGYELQGLTMVYPDGRTVDLVGAYNAEINDDVTIKAVFVKTDALLKICVENGAVSGRQEMFVSPYSRVTAVPQAAPEGKVFAYWSQDGDDDVPVSYDMFYTFIATSDVTLKANYADAPVAQTANVTMDAQSPTHITVVNGMHTLSYSGKITVPEDAQIVEFGMVLTNQSSEFCNAENFVIGGKVNGVNVVKIVGQTLTEEGQVKINVNNVKPGQTRTGRLYLTVRLADGTTQTIYSNTWSQLQTPPAA